MRSSYKEKDVILLLKDITGLVEPLPAEQREKLIQEGKHYSEMLPVEYVPTRKYMEVYQQALEYYARPVAVAVGQLSDQIIKERGSDVVLVSLARAGIPVGILLRRYIRIMYGMDIPHYSVSIIRGKGIDHNAMGYLLARYRPGQLLFVDGWTGKGAIFRQLEQAVAAYPGVSPQLAVLADPAAITPLCGTHEDILIPSSCLNSTVSGLISRTFLRDDIIGPDDFHGAVYYGELKDADLSYAYIHAIQKHFEAAGQFLREQAGYGSARQNQPDEKPGQTAYGMGGGMREVEDIARKSGITDINLIKPGIGETTRVLLRRIPWMILTDQRYRGDRELGHIVRLAEEKGTQIQYYPLKHYKCCGIIRKMADT